MDRELRGYRRRPPPALSVVSPCHNEEECLLELRRRVSETCRSIVGDDYEIVLVDDGSRDNTWRIISELAAVDNHVVGVLLSRNFGHQIALSAGLEVCSGARILTIDADLQDPPELVGDMMRLMDQGYDIVYGQRAERRGETVFKKVTAALFYRILRRLAAIDIPADTGDFRLMNRRALSALLRMPERQRFIRGMVCWIGFRHAPIIYKRDERLAGATKYPLRKMIHFAIDAITSFSIIPLRMATYLGLIFALFGLVALGLVLRDWATNEAVQGWTSVMTAILLLGSMQLIFVGILGEYIGRLYIEAKQRPQFLIQQLIRASGHVEEPQTLEMKELDSQAS